MMLRKGYSVRADISFGRLVEFLQLGGGVIYKDGVLIYEGYDAHFMVTVGARDEATGIVWNADRTAPYSPMNSAD